MATLILFSRTLVQGIFKLGGMIKAHHQSNINIQGQLDKKQGQL